MRSRLLAGWAVLAACSGTTPDAGRLQDIELVQEVQLESSGDSLDFSLGSKPIIASNGSIVVGHVASARGMLATFAPDGTPAKIFGRPGQGPGEMGLVNGQQAFSGIGLGPGDSIFVGDGGNGRVLVFSPPPAAEFVRSFKQPFLLHSFATVPAGFMMGPSLVSPGFVPGTEPRKPGEPFSMIYMAPRVMSWDGQTILAEYGKRVNVSDSRIPIGAYTLADSGRIWGADPHAYRIDLIENGGKVLRSLRRDVPWFPVDTTDHGFPWEKPPRTAIHSLTMDGDRLWVLIRRAHRNWAKHSPVKPFVLKPGMPMTMMPTFRSDELFEGVIEVLDTRTGALLAAKEVSGDFFGFLSPGRLYQQVEDSSGLLSLRVWKTVLRKR